MSDLKMSPVVSTASQKTTIDWDEQNRRLAQWVQTDDARQVFCDIDTEIHAETDSLRERTIINHEELQKQFTI